ncbi:MAG: carbamoyltransferase HypF [candidate division KSB1 bacterium]|nr:carbamoyltransferase HypF [candidate division KSB1 bacterium]
MPELLQQVKVPLRLGGSYEAQAFRRKAVNDEPLARLRVTIRGAVQGVGFRPFVYRLATALELTGWVSNSSSGVFIEVEGTPAQLEIFLLRLEKEKPPRSFIQSLESSFLDPAGYAVFEIRPSEERGEKTALVLPDIATCPDCLREIFDPANRRYRYPFTNCTNCGPRFTIIEALPYDRPNTTMKKFVMCATCRQEYDDPLDRRFHAQPNACPACGPQLELWDQEGLPLSTKEGALFEAVDALMRGKIVAVKGLGGFHLMVDAGNEEAVQRLRRLKHREEKPFALMFPNLEMVKLQCEVSKLEERLLLSPESPIVLLRQKSAIRNPQSVIAPRNPYLGIMLPYTPLHHLLLADLQAPVVATSANLTDEPICIDERDALQRLGGIADVFLVHNRPIARHVDDSIVRVMAGRELVLRRARGFAPLPIHLKEPVAPALAVGAHLKNAIALSVGNDVFVSQHIGDLETAQAYEAFQRVIEDFKTLYEVQPASVVCDLHPEYLSTKFAQGYSAIRDENMVRRGAFRRSQTLNAQPLKGLLQTQHHFAHVVACMAENELEGTVLGVSWDGTGYGLDGTMWGGEFLRATTAAFERLAHFRTFRLAGGEKAIKEPRRVALGVLYEIFGDEVFAMKELAPVRAFSSQELALLKNMLAQKLNAPLTSSAGRLFDAVAAILGLRQQTKFEGQTAMELEFVLDGVAADEEYPFELFTINRNGSPATIIVDWAPMMRQLIEEHRRGMPVAKLSAKFHNTLVAIIIAVARRVGENRVVLTGGCFQNQYLTERTVYRLRREGFRPYWHQRVPPNDGGIALGQAVAAAASRRET